MALVNRAPAFGAVASSDETQVRPSKNSRHDFAVGDFALEW